MILYRKTFLGRIGIQVLGYQITRLLFESDLHIKDLGQGDERIAEEAFVQLNEYLNGERRIFALPLEPVGTDFMRSVWKSLCNIPYGTTSTYKAVAEMVGRPKVARAVGMANNKNPIPIFIPCHRVIGSSGKLTGYRGGIELKQKLLDIEARRLF